MPCALIIFEDEHLLVINKPAGVNTHAPSPFAGEGIYEWLKNREPRWANLAIIQRLDKETSGVMVFGKTPLANRSLTEQFTNRTVRKKYLLLTKAKVCFRETTVKSTLSRIGDKYMARPAKTGDELAETMFRVLGESAEGTLIEARPITGRTHQIRVHASANQFPILGDGLYGGAPFQRVCLQAAELSFSHPATGEPVTFTAVPDFLVNARLAIREITVDPSETDAFRILHGAADAWPGWYVEKLGEFLLSQSQNRLSPAQGEWLHQQAIRLSIRGVYHKALNRHVRGSAVKDSSPEFVFGEPITDPFVISENSVRFAINFNEGYSVGLFLDQRENRRRFLTRYVGPQFLLPESPEVLNTFAYTCGFSVCAAKSGAKTTSLDLSKKYLEWGKRNFALNELSSDGHDFIYGDVFDWMRRLKKKGRGFDVIVLDPPTFSQSKESGVFRAEKDYGRLIELALPLLRTKGILLASTNCATLEPEKFLETIQSSISAGGRNILQQQYVPQPLDFPVIREEPAYLRTVWIRIS